MSPALTSLSELDESWAWWSRYLEIPFVDNGRDLEGCDCWGLARLVYRAELGIELPSYAAEYEDTFDKSAIVDVFERESAKWQRVDDGDRRPFDILWYAILGVPCHVMIATTGNRALHTFPKQATSNPRVDGVRWAKRFRGAYRHREIKSS